MPARSLALNEPVLHFFSTAPSAHRRLLLEFFRVLRADPGREPDFHIKDDTGRPMKMTVHGPLLVTWWVDPWIEEVRVIEVRRLAPNRR